MSRGLICLLILAIGLAVLLSTGENQHILGMPKDDFADLVYLVPIALLLSAGIWRSRHRVSQSIRYLLTWTIIILGLASAYIYRNDFASVGNRVFAGLVPGHAVVTTASDGQQEVILQKARGGHFQATVNVNGVPIPMMVDTGASLIALSREDARTIGIDLDNLQYTMSVLTANGRTMVAPVRLAEVSVGPIIRKDVQGSVAMDDSLDGSLLGMSYLGTLGSLQMQTDELRLRN
ncbi:TIGR02281 family clan AA aspartic protease [Oryzifoliimicrobium ureilyticus]|uniref:TIGR02281 family clan AA aspartic protease n=1 Tax=Oryzifoliimicrobium ureilyticus TaxID=3113724 RepID=UPI003076380A